MGYALFTARKLSLTARVNNLNAQLMSISNQRDALTNQITQKQNAANIRTAQANATAATKYASIMQGDDEDAKKNAESDYNKSVADNEVANTISDLEIQALQAKDNALDTTQQSIQTRLTAAQKELEAVEKAEESAIDHATPKYAG